MSDFWSISLCNVVYKLASEVLANRLIRFLSFIISASQSAFISEVLISDNVITAYEILFEVKTERESRQYGP